MLNLATLLEHSAKEYPDKTAIVFDEMRLTYAQLNAAACQVANLLQSAGVHKGEKVALSCPNLPYFPIVYYGILKAGAVVVPLNVLLKRREISYHLSDSDAVAYFCFEGTDQLPMGQEGWAAFQEVEGCRNFYLITADPKGASPIHGATTLGQAMASQQPAFDTVQTRPDDTSVILYTSGTTGRPKGAELSHSNIVMNAIVSRDICNGSSEDTHLIVLPLFHSFGQTVQLNSGILCGCTLVLQPRFAPGPVLDALAKEEVTIFCGVPTMYWELLNQPNLENYDLEKISRNLRLGASGGSAMPVELMRRFEERFNITILEGYGLSETSPVATFNLPEKPRKPGSIGLPVWGVEVRVVDEHMNDKPVDEPGEIVIRGHNVMKGYYKRPEATDEVFYGGWFHTGDVGKKDADGYFYVVDRTKDMILRGGFNVYPREIEETLMTHPKVTLAAVIGVPDEEYGEEIKAYVVPAPGASIEPDEVRAWAKQEMAAYKYPRYVEVRKSLPMNATGKVLKTELRKEEEKDYVI